MPVIVPRAPAVKPTRGKALFPPLVLRYTCLMVTAKNTLAFLLAASLALASVSCRKREAPGPPPPPAPDAPKPAQAFADPELQRQYEAVWTANAELFQAPSTGSLLYVQRTDGSFLGGTVTRWSDTNLVLRQGKRLVDLGRADIAPASLPEIYLKDFADAYARRDVERGPAPATTARVARTRYSLTDAIEPRTGPGARYRRIDNLDIPKGSTLLVLEERHGWLRVKTRAMTDEQSFWVNQFTTIPTPDAPEEDLTQVISGLLESQFLAGFDPAQNQAMVPREAWIGTDPAVQEGISRVLAAHSRRIRGSGVDWVEIKDVENGRRLARYSQAQGFRPQ